MPEKGATPASFAAGRVGRWRERLLNPYDDGPVVWLWFTGVARIGFILVVVLGAQLVVTQNLPFLVLTGIYLAALACSTLYLVTLRRAERVSSLLTWTQTLLDFSVVAMTIGFTGGQESLFTFLLVVVVLEAGVLLGLFQGFLFALLASAFMVLISRTQLAPGDVAILHWYNLTIQGLAFFATAFISGYWNQRLSRMKQFQREILDNMSSGFLITDARGRITGVNRGACRILGLDEGAVLGRQAEEVLQPESGLECPIMTAIRESRDYASYECMVRTADGQSRLLGLTTTRLLDHQQRVATLIAAFSDLTEIARMRQELRRHDRMAVIGELAAELAHEIRNPVTSIRGAMEEMRRGGVDPSVMERLATIAIRESDHLNEIVTGFLEFSRTPELKRFPVDLSAMAWEMQQIFSSRYPAMHVVVEGEEDLVVQGDATRLRQLFLNLCQNAAEAMSFAGDLVIALRQQHNLAEIRFDDDGPGIPPDKVARIFEPFYTEKQRGVGMGLPICTRIVTAHDGVIQAAARPSGGASMIVRLPIAQG